VSTVNAIHDEVTFRRAAALAAIASAPLAAGNLLAMLWAARLNLDALSDPSVLLRIGEAGAGLWRWSMVLDLFGYYLLIVPLLLFLRTWLRPRSPNWIDLFVLCLLAYCLIGAIGAAMLATATPPLIEAYPAAAPPTRAILEAVAGALSDSVYRGLWNLLEECLAGIGWLGLGLVLISGRRRLGMATVLLGAACLVDSLGSILRSEAISMAGLAPYLVLAPLWAAWMGVVLLRDRADPLERVGRVNAA